MTEQEIQEKAKELVERCRGVEIWIIEGGNSTYPHKMSIDEAKQCAIICVEREYKQLHKMADLEYINNTQYHELLNESYLIQEAIEKL